MNILIATTPDDSHAINVKLALERKGCNPLLWYMADFPMQQRHSFAIEDKDIFWEAIGTDFVVNNDKFDVVWYRRPKKPTLSKSIHEDDSENSEKENAMLYHTFWEVIATDATWINPVKSARAANSKLLQLRNACKCGLKIPPTLISNDPAKIYRFIDTYGEGNVIYKTLHPLYWVKDNALRLTYTNKIKSSDLPSSEILQSTAGIYQKVIDKSYELRVTYFGNQAIAVKINSQSHKRGFMDWRSVPIDELPIEEYILPEDIDIKCRNLLSSLGLIFGCFDFIVTKDNEYIFLEVNESGQFLWIEALNPDIKMLDVFTDFMMARGKGFTIEPNKQNELSLLDFKDEAQQLFETAIKAHQNTHILN